MKQLLYPVLGAAILAGCAGAPEAPQASVEQAVVTVPAAPGGPGAAYFTLRTNTEGTRLVSIASPAIRSIELHATREQGGRTQMVPLQPGETRFGPGQPLPFAPGGNHAMLMGVEPSLRPGGRVPLTFTFEGAPAVTVEAEVRGPGQGHLEH